MIVYKFAGFWRRLVAFMIDSTIVTIIFVVLCVITALAFFFGAMSADNNTWIADLTNLTGFSSLLLLILVFYIAINIAYFTYFHGTTGRTPGKMLLGLQVCSADGTEVSFGIAFLRAVGYLVSSLLLTIPIGFIWAAFDKKKQAWHDKIAGTVLSSGSSKMNQQAFRSPILRLLPVSRKLTEGKMIQPKMLCPRPHNRKVMIINKLKGRQARITKKYLDKGTHIL